jgi:hypothetical protein
MNLGEMKDWIVRDTKRPDKREDQVQDAINAALEYATTSCDFSSDLIEGSIAISSAVNAQSLPISSTFPRFRKIKYLRPSNYRNFLCWKDPSRIFDHQQRQYTDVWYRSGDNIVFNLSVKQSLMLYAYYQYPLFLTSDDATHWMLDQMRTCIHDLACWRVFEQIGNESEASRFFKIGDEFLKRHKSDLQDAVSLA